MSPRWWPLCQDLLQRGGSSGGQSMDQIFSILNQLCKILNNCHSATFRFKWYDYIFTYTYTYTHYIYIIYIYQIYIYIYRSVVTKIHQNFLSRFGLGLLDQPRLGPFCHFKKGHGRLWVGALFAKLPEQSGGRGIRVLQREVGVDGLKDGGITFTLDGVGSQGIKEYLFRFILNIFSLTKNKFEKGSYCGSTSRSATSW